MKDSNEGDHFGAEGRWEWAGWMNCVSLEEAAKRIVEGHHEFDPNPEPGDRYFLTPDGTGGMGLMFEVRKPELPLQYHLISYEDF
jgi:hypothetical protein